LREAKAEDVTPHWPWAGGLYLRPDDEQEHHDTKFGDLEDGHRVREYSKAEGAEGKAFGELFQYESEPGALEERHGDDCGTQKGDDCRQINAVGLMAMDAPLSVRVAAPFEIWPAGLAIAMAQTSGRAS